MLFVELIWPLNTYYPKRVHNSPELRYNYSMSEHLELNGEIVNSCKGIFKVLALNDDGTPMLNSEGKEMIVTCSIAGRLRKNKIQLLVSDLVTFKVSGYNLERGFITFRMKKPRSKQDY